MILQFLFPHLSLSSQATRLQNDGISLGTRIKNGRKIYVYMFRDLFVEVSYVNDSPAESAERVNVLKGVKNLNAHLEKEFRASF